MLGAWLKTLTTVHCTMGGHPDIGESSSFERDLNGKNLDTKLVMNHCSFTFVTMENLKNEAPQEVKYDEKLLIFGWFNHLWKLRCIFYTTNELRYIFYSWDTR